jgi:hypothetical protein
MSDSSPLTQNFFACGHDTPAYAALFFDYLVIVSTAVPVPPLRVAEIVADVLDETVLVVTVKLALTCPSGITTLPGMRAALLLVERNAAVPPGGAACVRVTVPIDELPPRTLVGFNERLATEADGGGASHWPALHVPPFEHPQLIVPPQPSGTAPQAVTSTQLFGRQPAVTTSGSVSGCCPLAPEIALMVTVVCWGTEAAA